MSRLPTPEGVDNGGQAKMSEINMKRIKIILIVVIILVIAGVIFWFFGNRSVDIKNNNQVQGQDNENKGQISPITGEKCVNYNNPW